MLKRTIFARFWPLLTATTIISCKTTPEKSEIIENEKPNVIIVYADDLGYGDLSCYGATAINTPNIDSLAAQGVRFTDAHCTAATCSPSRYSLLTGSYAFRNNARILPGDAPLLIDTNTYTLPTLFKNAGYSTAVIGKWHLGLGAGNIDWNGNIYPGANQIGFDYSFLLPATGDRVPCVYVENGKIVNLDTIDPLSITYHNQKIGNLPDGINNPELLRQRADTQHNRTIVNGISRIGYQAGGVSALWRDEDFPIKFLEKTENFLNQSKGKPFFLYLALHDIHVPRVVNEQFVGKSKLGPRGDAILQTDWLMGELRAMLANMGIEQNTLIIFSSDNGPVLNDGYHDLADSLNGDHKPAGPLRGGKYSAFEAGTRVPQIVYWPKGAQKGVVSDALFSHVDMLATFAKITNVQLPSGAGIDSEAFADVLLGKSTKGRVFMVEESSTLSLRMNNWKYIRKKKVKNTSEDVKKIELGIDTVPQLYHLTTDIAEQVNVASQHPDTLNAMATELERIIGLSVNRK